MELWIKDLKYFKADRMPCGSYHSNFFRLFLYAAAFVVAHAMKKTLFKETDVENFTTDSLIMRIMLSADFIVEKKTSIRISFSPHHRHIKGTGSVHVKACRLNFIIPYPIADMSGQSMRFIMPIGGV